MVILVQKKEKDAPDPRLHARAAPPAAAAARRDALPQPLSAAVRRARGAQEQRLQVGEVAPVALGAPDEPAKRGITRDYTPFPSNITRDDPPITRDCTPFLLILQGMTLQLQGIVLPPF